MAKTHFHGLDALRGVAAIAVFTRHVPDRTFAHWLPGSYLAVDLFFALSGFVIAHAYAERLASGMSFRQFGILRLIRLYPLYALGTSIGLLVAMGQMAFGKGALPNTMASTLAATLFLPTPPSLSADGVHAFPLNVPAWSLFYELLVNGVYALIALRLSERLLAAVIASGFALLVFTALYHGSLDGGSDCADFFVGGGRVWYSFFLGVALYRLRRFWRLKPVGASTACLLMLAAFAAPANEWRSLFDLSVVAIGFPVLILATAAHQPGPRAAAVCSWLGVISYALYAIHEPFVLGLTLVVGKLTGRGLEQWGPGGTVAVGVLMVAAAMVAHRFYDVPARAWLSRQRSVRVAVKPT